MLSVAMVDGRKVRLFGPSMTAINRALATRRELWPLPVALLLAFPAGDRAVWPCSEEERARARDPAVRTLFWGRTSPRARRTDRRDGLRVGARGVDGVRGGRGRLRGTSQRRPRRRRRRRAARRHAWHLH